MLEFESLSPFACVFFVARLHVDYVPVVLITFVIGLHVPIFGFCFSFVTAPAVVEAC